MDIAIYDKADTDEVSSVTDVESYLSDSKSAKWKVDENNVLYEGYDDDCTISGTVFAFANLGDSASTSRLSTTYPPALHSYQCALGRISRRFKYALQELCDGIRGRGRLRTISQYIERSCWTLQDDGTWLYRPSPADSVKSNEALRMCSEMLERIRCVLRCIDVCKQICLGCKYFFVDTAVVRLVSRRLTLWRIYLLDATQTSGLH